MLQLPKYPMNHVSSTTTYTNDTETTHDYATDQDGVLWSRYSYRRSERYYTPFGVAHGYGSSYMGIWTRVTEVENER